MKLKYRHPELFWGITGFVLSLGAPLGFYLHDFIFSSHQSPGFIEHIIHIHQHHFSTILYVGLSTHIFFTLFGVVVGHFFSHFAKLSSRQAELQSKKEHIIREVLVDVKRPISLTLEYLDMLKAEEMILTPEQEDELQAKLFQELEFFNNKINLILGERLHFQEKNHCSDFITRFESGFYNAGITADKINISPDLQDYHISIDSEFLELLFDIWMDYLFRQEIKIDQLLASITYVEASQDSYLSIIIKSEGFKFYKNAPLILDDMVERLGGRCIFSKSSLAVMIPVERELKKQEAA